MKAAEQARLAYLGANQAECVPWDELKPEMWERWARVVDVAQKPIYAERDALRAELADWKAGRYIAVVPGPEHAGVSHGVMVPPIRVAELKAEMEPHVPILNILRTQLDAVTAERDKANQEMQQCWNFLNEAKPQCVAPTFRLANAVKWMLDELAALRQPVDADAWKTDLRLTSPLNHNHRMNLSCADDKLVLAKWLLLEHKESGFSVIDAPSAARASQWLASYAAAHGCPVVLTAPNATPTDAQVEALARVLHKAQDGFYCRYGDHATKFDDYAPLWLAFARAAYAHIGRVPVGWELDVTEDEIHDTFTNAPSGAWRSEILDLCRSRSRPIYDCNECAKWRSYGTKMEDNARVLAKRIDKTRMSMDAARAALEGE